MDPANALEENRRLRRTMRDLVALSTLPAVWIGLGPEGIARSLADVLLNTLALDLIYLRLSDGVGAWAVEVVRRKRAAAADVEAVRNALAPLLDATQPESTSTILDPASGGKLRVAATRFGIGDDRGILIAGALNPQFPTEQDRLLLGVAANQTAIVVQRRRAEEQVHEHREWLRVTLASIGDAVIATDMDGRVTFLNAVAEELTGWTSTDAQGQKLDSVFVILNEYTRQKVENPVERVLREGVVVGMGNHTALIAKDGTERPIDDSAAPIRDCARRTIGVVLIFRDVTEQRRAEQERARAEAQIREHEQRTGVILESITDAFLALDRDWRFTYVNRQAERLLGRTRDDLIGKDHWQEYPDTLGTAIERNFRRATAENVTIAFENYYPPHNRWYEVNAYPSPEGLSIYFRDVSERKRSESALRESELRFRELADAMPQIVFTARPDGNIDFLNRRWSEFTGLPQAVGNEGWSKLLHPEDAPTANARWAASLRGGDPFEMEIRLLDQRQQTYRWHLIRTVAVLDRDGRVARWFGTGTDIHVQKRAEETSRFLAEASAELARVVDYESTLQKVANLAVPYFADWSAVDLADDDGKLRRLAVAHQDPEKIALVRELAREYPPDPRSSLGAYAVLRTGKPEIMSEISDEMLVRAARDERHLRLVRSLGLKSYICLPLIVSGKTLGILTFVTAESGRRYAESDLALAMDLSHRAAVAIENTQLYQALRDADQRKDEFLATLAHELRNPLAPVRNALQILKMPRVDVETAQRSREMMERQVQQLVRLVDDLLDVSRVMRGKIELRKERIELAAVVARAVETVQPMVEAQRHELSVRVAPEPLPLYADSVRLAQVVGNLLANAAKYTEPGGRIWLTAERVDESAVLRVRDTGIGVAPLMLPRIFDLFVQADHAATRSQGGLGIGLTLVKNLVEMHNGTVQAYSEGLGRGCEFVVRLPLAQQTPDPDAAAEKEREDPQSPAATGKRLLVVDDNQDAANSLAMLLRLHGHEVKVAFSAVAALEMTSRYTPDIVFMDIGMPGMDGYEAARRMRQQPGLEKVRLAAVTGWGQLEDRRRTSAAGFDHHFVKPVEPSTLEGLLADLNAKG